jgi:signal transduction histidine kinase
MWEALLDSSDPFPGHLLTEALRRHGFTEPDAEMPLRGIVRLASAFCGIPAFLVLVDGLGQWFLDKAGFADGQDPDLAGHLILEPNAIRFNSFGYRLAWTGAVMDQHRRTSGFLCLVASSSAKITETQQAGLEQLVLQIETLIESKRQGSERRAAPRGPTGASFVPGLAHELKNFIFGISASLDALEARFAEQKDFGKYGANLRLGLDRLNAFTAELLEYGDPKAFSWAEESLQRVLREVIDHHLARAALNNIQIQLQVEGTLPPIRMDERHLHYAFVRLTELALQLEDPGGCIIIHVSTRPMGEQSVIFGYLDIPGLRFQDADCSRLFEPFFFRASGVGRLALPVARRIFEAHGGNLTAVPLPNGYIRMNFLLPSV